MNDFQRVVLAALIHDLRSLPQIADLLPSHLLEVYEDPTWSALLDQAEAYASAKGLPGQALESEPLRSIFSCVRGERLQEADEDAPVGYWPLAPLTAVYQDEGQWFPIQDRSKVGNRQKHLDRFAEELKQCLDDLGEADFDRLYHHLRTLLLRWLWCVPAHTEDGALCDHLTLTAAVAACLYRYHQATGDLGAEAIEDAEEIERFFLLVGDLSGIQPYIFDIASIGAGGVARSLRARSFFVALLSEVISHRVVDVFDLPLGNVVMASGGKFYVLLPNHQVESRVQTIRQEVDSWLREEFNAEIGVNLETACFSGAAFGPSRGEDGGFGYIITQLSFALQSRKQRRAYEVLRDGNGWGEDSFRIKKDFWGRGDCQSCHKLPADRDDGLCPHCRGNRELGGRLPRTNYVAYYRGEGPEGSLTFLRDQYAVAVFRDEEELAQGGSTPYLVVRLNDPRTDRLRDYPATFRYLANHVPVEDGRPKTFEEIAKAVKKGRHLLGYVKADVDRLGEIFALGLQRDGAGFDTAPRLVALSRELDRFFSGWLEHTLSERDGQYVNFYTIFSGGDDLFLLGPWDRAADLAQHVREQFSAFVGQNPDVTLSAGILFTKERYPIGRAWEDAEEALEQSKEGGRDRLTLLGDTLTWDEAQGVFADVNALTPHEQDLNSAFLYNLVEYSLLYRAYLKGKIKAPRYKAMFAYNIARNLRKGKREVFEWADQLMQSLDVREENPRMRHLGVVATYLLFTKRGGNT